MDTRSESQTVNNNEIIFTQEFKVVWLELIFPLLEDRSNYNTDLRLKSIWHIAGTCKSARNIALQYLKPHYSKDQLLNLETRYQSTIAKRWKHGYQCSQLLFNFNPANDGFLIFNSHCIRFLSVFSFLLGLLGMMISSLNMANDPSDLFSEYKYNNAKYITAISGVVAMLCSLPIIANNYSWWARLRDDDNQELSYSRKQRDKATAKLLTLFGETKQVSVVERIKHSCNIL